MEQDKRWFSNPNLVNLDKVQFEEMMADYSLVFDGDRGVEVLLCELVNLCFFRECKSEIEMEKSNHAKELLCRIGIWHPENAKKIVRKLLEVV